MEPSKFFALNVCLLNVGIMGCGASNEADIDEVLQGVCSTLNVYMSPTGSDANTGLSSSQPVKTLERVQNVIRQAAPQCATTVKVGLGTYYAQSVDWTYRTDFEIKFEPADGYASKVRPVFNGCSASGVCNQLTWFTVSVTGSTRLNFRYLRVQRYSTAISMNGNRDTESESIRHNKIYGMYFKAIGNGWAGAESHGTSTAAIRFVNADSNAVENCHFYDVTNRASGGLLHALYIAHSSDANYVARNVFETVSGDAIRVRDYCFDNVIEGNRITRAGSVGYSEWFCDSDSRPDCTKPDECWSWENTFSNNTLDGTYSCSTMPVWKYFQTSSAGNCTRPPRGAVRLHTFGNTRSSTPCSL